MEPRATFRGFLGRRGEKLFHDALAPLRRIDGTRLFRHPGMDGEQSTREGLTDLAQTELVSGAMRGFLELVLSALGWRSRYQAFGRLPGFCIPLGITLLIYL